MTTELKDLHDLKSILTGVTWSPGISNQGGAEQPGYTRWRMGPHTYTVHEDPSDGYRSYAGPLIVDDGGPIETEIPPTIVRCEHRDGGNNDSYSCDILTIIDVETGLPVLEVGTDNTDDYYPSCVMSWRPENLICNKK